MGQQKQSGRGRGQESGMNCEGQGLSNQSRVGRQRCYWWAGWWRWGLDCLTPFNELTRKKKQAKTPCAGQGLPWQPLSPWAQDQRGINWKCVFYVRARWSTEIVMSSLLFEPCWAGDEVVGRRWGSFVLASVLQATLSRFGVGPSPARTCGSVSVPGDASIPAQTFFGDTNRMRRVMTPIKHDLSSYGNRLFGVVTTATLRLWLQTTHLFCFMLKQRISCSCSIL